MRGSSLSAFPKFLLNVRSFDLSITLLIISCCRNIIITLVLAVSVQSVEKNTHKLLQKNKINMMKFIGEALQEMKEKTEESKITQRFNKYCCFKDWRNRRRYSTLQPRSW